MNRNGRTVKLSDLDPNRYSLPSERNSKQHQRRNPTIVCESCNTYCQVRHGLIEVHRPDGIRCADSGTKVVFDVSPVQWEQALYFATIATDRRRSNRVKIKPEPAVSVPVCRPASGARPAAPTGEGCPCPQCKPRVMPKPIAVRAA